MSKALLTANDSADPFGLINIVGLFPGHGSGLQNAEAAVVSCPGEVGALRVVPASLTTLAARHLRASKVLGEEVAGESPVLPRNPVDRVGRGGEEKSKENGGLHHGWSLGASQRGPIPEDKWMSLWTLYFGKIESQGPE